MPKLKRRTATSRTVQIRRLELVDLLGRLQATCRLVEVTMECVRAKQGDSSKLGRALDDLEVVATTLQDACLILVRMAVVDATLGGMFFDHFANVAAKSERPRSRTNRRKNA